MSDRAVTRVFAGIRQAAGRQPASADLVQKG
jgi:hypothetical protein